MQRTVLQENNLNPNFIGSWMMEPTSLCDRLMDYFESHQGKQRKGSTGAGMNLGYKNSTDISISPMKSVCLVMKYLKSTLKASSTVIKIILPSGRF